MKTAAVIAEYNPFHNGHKYQLDQIRKLTGADNIIIIMSGDFVQRGYPAITNKYIRSQMAVNNGADIVFELPVRYSTASAPYFALAAVSIIHSLGFIDYLCFGCEVDDIGVLSSVAKADLTSGNSYINNNSAFSSETSSDDDSINSNDMSVSKSGFASKRTEYIASKLPEILSLYPDLLSSPNNILAIEYIKALMYLNSDVKPIAIKRMDNGYNCNTPSSLTIGSSVINMASASYIRTNYSPDKPDLIKSYIPDSVSSLFKNDNNCFLKDEIKLSEMLYYKLNEIIYSENSNISSICDDLCSYEDVTKQLAMRIINNFNNFTAYSDFASVIKVRNFTYTRISRALLHILLGIKKLPASYNHLVPYTRLLAIKKEKSSILRQTDFTIITKTANGISQLQDLPDSEYAQLLFNETISASNIYRRLLFNNTYPFKDDYHTNISII